MGMQKIASFAFATGGTQIVELSRVQQMEAQGKLAYLESLVVHLDVTDLDDVGAGAAVEDIHGLLAGLTVEAGDGYYGPRGLSGADLSALSFVHKGRATKNIELEGDIATTSASNQIRQLVWEYPYAYFGGKFGDFSPAVKTLANNGGRITVNMGTTIASATAGTFTIYAKTFGGDELRAVPRIISERQGVDVLEGGGLGRGLMLSAILKNAGDWADGDIDEISVRCDGQNVVSGVEAEVLLYDYPTPVAESTAQLFQNTGIGPIDGAGGAPRFIPIYPPTNPSGQQVSKLHSANAWTYSIRGNETAANLTWITTRALRMSVGHAVDQYAAMVGDRTSVEDLIRNNPESAVRTKTLSKTLLTKPALQGYLPLKLLSPEATRRAGIVR